jgi:type VI secretion system protein ImpM
VLGAAVTAQCWAGVLMPSVDRVGRYFPFTIVQPMGAGPGTNAQMQSLWHWLGRLDELAGDALQDDWDVERIEAELSRMAAPWRGAAGPEQPAAVELPAAPVADGQLLELPLAAGADAGEALGAEAQRCWAAHADGLAYWYAQPEAKPARLLCSRGLPGAASLARLLGATI